MPPVSLRSRVFQLANLVERYVLSLVFLAMAARDVWGVVDTIATRPTERLEQGRWVVELIRQLDVFAVFVLVGFLLLRSRPPVQGPRTFQELVVPAVVSAFFLVYELQAWLPAALRKSWAPLAVQVPCAWLSLLMAAAGSVLSLWGVLTLGRSFGVFVAVRKVITAGPYRYVRHPIYAGYLLSWLGQILVNLSVAIVALVTVHTLLMIYRARLEERRLAEASPEYRAYLERTGFLFPKLRSRGLPRVLA